MQLVHLAAAAALREAQEVDTAVVARREELDRPAPALARLLAGVVAGGVDAAELVHTAEGVHALRPLEVQPHLALNRGLEVLRVLLHLGA